MEPRWYRHFKQKGDRKCIVSDYGMEKLGMSRVVSCETHNGKRVYAVFDSHVTLYNYIMKCHPGSRVMHEVILSDFCQKPYFDVDIEIDSEVNHEDILKLTIDAIIGVLSRDDVKLDIERDVIIMESHGCKKYSYHIVIANVMHFNRLEAKGFYEAVIDFNPDLKKYLDSVYSANHTFRMLHNTKYGVFRPLNLVDSFTYNDVDYIHKSKTRPVSDKHLQLVLFAESLVCMVSGCSTLPSYTPKDLPRQSNFIIGEGQASVMMKLCFDKYGDVFTCNQVSGSTIFLERLSSSYCELCLRVHDSYPPRLFIIGSNVYWTCGRSDSGKRQYIGRLPLEMNLKINPYQQGLISSDKVLSMTDIGENTLTFESIDDYGELRQQNTDVSSTRSTLHRKDSLPNKSASLHIANPRQSNISGAPIAKIHNRQPDVPNNIHHTVPPIAQIRQKYNNCIQLPQVEQVCIIDHTELDNQLMNNIRRSSVAPRKRRYNTRPTYVANRGPRYRGASYI